MEHKHEKEQTVEVNTKALESMVNLIDIVSTRGAFRGEELEGVGQFRNNLAKISGMISTAAPQNEEVSPEETPELLTEET
jgi:hypothetical protein